MRRIFYFNALVLAASLVFLSFAPTSADGDDAKSQATTETRAAK
jgi:hypothetical protein